MSIIKRLLGVIKIKLLDFKFLEKYTSAYQKAYNNIYNITTNDSEMTTKVASMLFQRALLVNMVLEYTSIASIIKLE